MLISVVIITRNRSAFLDQCLKSIEKQNMQVEIIVVDNASTDDTLAMLKSQHPSVVVLEQNYNKGAPGGRNIGIGYAKGDLCLCIDDDAELISENALEKCILYFERNPKLACLALLIIDDTGKVVRKLIPRRDRQVITEDTPGALFSATGCVIRRSAFFDVEGFWEGLNPYFGEEPDLSYRLLEKGYDIVLTPHITVCHHETDLERHPSRRLYYGTRNTPWLALRNLPWYSVISLTTLSWGYFFMIAVIHHQLRDFFRAVTASIRHMPAIYHIRNPVSKRTRRLLWRYSGVILW